VRAAGREGSTWYLGHWGWMHYAERAGLRPLQTTGPAPQPGEHVVVPRFVDKGAVLERRPALRARLRLVDEVAAPGRSPLRTVHDAGAGFYAQRTRRPGGGRPDLPWRWLPGAPLEIFDVYEVQARRARSEP
jgi:hypothetical protein